MYPGGVDCHELVWGSGTHPPSTPRGSGVEAGGILGVNIPHFLECSKKWELEGGNKKVGDGENLGGVEKFLDG